ncbi:lectin OAA family protein [Janthinobacterium agaricidamnosum]|uniref:lectin OAA family protein n=1 Tax=Janthinobacterium agaricidamnosum TaxID=55508 RepID=UPI00077416C5|nr:hypothetical protein [Janthinobacterium agaricidamnosum]
MSKTSKSANNLHHVKNQWGGPSAPWNEGGVWVLGGRSGQNVAALNINSADGGNTFTGAMKYVGEGQIGFRATLTQSNTYLVENQWGGDSAPWNPGGTWVIGGRSNQNVVALNVESSDGGNTLAGSMSYNGEGPIGFSSELVDGGVFTVENQWGGGSAPWNPGGTWVIGARDQGVAGVDISSADNGKTLTGSMSYVGEGPIGFRATAIAGNNYQVENQWGGNSAPWRPGGVWLIGARGGQSVVALKITSDDSGNSLNGSMNYSGEGPIGFRGFIEPQ